jgi:hypothetical protein
MEGEAEESGEGQVRPKTIVYFERLVFGTLLLSALHNYLVWDQIIGPALAEDAALDRNTAVAIAITAIIFNFVLVGTLTLLVSHRRSKIAMWLLIAQGALVLSLTALGIIQARRLLASDVIWEALEIVGQVVAYALLFTSSARRWMRREDEKTEKLREVFE